MVRRLQVVGVMYAGLRMQVVRMGCWGEGGVGCCVERGDGGAGGGGEGGV